MHLILDIGNTNVKYHLFDQEESVLSATINSIELVADQVLVDFPDYACNLFRCSGNDFTRKATAYFFAAASDGGENPLFPFYFAVCYPSDARR